MQIHNIIVCNSQIFQILKINNSEYYHYQHLLLPLVISFVEWVLFFVDAAIIKTEKVFFFHYDFIEETLFLTTIVMIIWNIRNIITLDIVIGVNPLHVMIGLLYRKFQLYFSSTSYVYFYMVCIFHKMTQVAESLQRQCQ